MSTPPRSASTPERSADQPPQDQPPQEHGPRWEQLSVPQIHQAIQDGRIRDEAGNLRRVIDFHWDFQRRVMRRELDLTQQILDLERQALHDMRVIRQQERDRRRDQRHIRQLEREILAYRQELNLSVEYTPTDPNQPEE